MTDPIADMLTRIRNANAVSKKTVTVPYSKLKEMMASLLKQEGYIADFEVQEKKGTPFKNIHITLRYEINGPKITHIKRVSTPGCRVYVKKEEIPTVLNNFGISILSTSKGLMTDKQAKRQGIGGEVLCEVY